MAPAWSAMIVGIEFRFLRQFGTGLDGFNDKREAFFVPSHSPPIIIMNWGGEIVVLVVVNVVVVVDMVVVVTVLAGGRSFRKGVKQSSFIVLQLAHL